MDKTEELAGTVQIAHDAGQFKTLEGNRPIDRNHVRKLIKSIQDQGNLTQEFPIVVNEHMEILDGQHRVEALKELGMPIAYEVRNNLSMETVRVINATHKNWTWLDYARSYASQGLHDYRRLLNLYEQFGFGLSILTYYTDSHGYGGKRGSYYAGGMEMQDYAKGYDLLSKLSEAVEASGVNTRDFAIALKDIMESPEYDHERMIRKLRQHGHELASLRRKVDFMRQLEEIYNYRYSEANRVRLF